MIKKVTASIDRQGLINPQRITPGEELRKLSNNRHGKILASMLLSILAGSYMFYLSRVDLTDQRTHRLKIRKRIEAEVAETAISTK